MAIIPSNIPLSNEEEIKQKQQGIQPVGQPPQQKMGSGSFTNLQKYLQSNVGAGQRIAGQISQDVAKRAQKSSEALSEAEKVGQAVAAQKERVGQAGAIKTQIGDVAAGTGDVSALEAKAGDIGYLTGGQYVTEAEKARADLVTRQTEAQRAIGAIGQRAEALGSESGRYGLLSDIYRRPSYGAGQQRLDQLLLQKAGGNTLGQLQKSTAAQTLQQAGALESTVGTAQAGIKDVLAKGAEGQKSIQESLTSGLSGLERAQESEFQTRQKEQQDLLAALQEGFKGLGAQSATGGNITISQDLANKYKQATGKDISTGEVFNLLSSPTTAANLFSIDALQGKDVVTSDELKRMQLLSKLGGNLPTKYTEAAGDTRKELVKTGLDEAMQAEKEKFQKAAAETVLRGVGSGYNVGSIGGGLLGGPTSTATRYEEASSSIADYLKDPNAFRSNISNQEASLAGAHQTLQTTKNQRLEELRKQASGLDSTEYERRKKQIEDEFSQGKFSIAQQQSKVAAQKSLQSQLEEYLRNQGYGRQIVLEAPKVSDIASKPPTITGSLKG